jgi:hypothetical protein
MNRIYHPYWVWEDYKFGFYNNCSGSKKKEYLDRCVQLFNSQSKTYKYMMMVIDEWKFSCEHNLTNEALNRIAYIGQGACCLYAGIPATVTMEAWSLLSKDVQDRANSQAMDVLNVWINRNKRIQLCLNLD